MTQLNRDLMDFHIVPLVISANEEMLERVSNSENNKFRQKLAEDLRARLFEVEEARNLIRNGLTEEALAAFDKPCVFLVYFMEDDPIDRFLSNEFALLHLHTASVALFFFLPKVGEIPFKIKFEEVYLLNFGRPWKIYNLKEDWEQNYWEKIAFLKETLPICKNLLATALPKNRCLFHSGHRPLFLLAFLRIFHEELSISLFYASLEYLLMIIQTLTLLDFSVLESIAGIFDEDTEPAKTTDSVGASRDIHNFKEAYDRILLNLFVPKNQLSDGDFMQILKSTQKVLGPESPLNGMLQKRISEEIRSSLNDLFQELDLQSRLKPRANWIDLLESVITLRNSTKGHGVMYFLEKPLIRSMIEIVTEISVRLAELPGTLDILYQDAAYEPQLNSFVYFQALDHQEKQFMKSCSLRWSLADTEYYLSPLIMYSNVYDTFLYSGLSDDLKKVYLKNFATGMYLTYDLDEFGSEASSEEGKQ